MPTLEEIETQLQQRIATYPETAWGRKQADTWDQKTRFIYDTFQWNALRQALTKLEKPVADYAVNRWFSFWSAVAVEQIFSTLPAVEAHPNRFDRLIDFSIQGLDFDHKTSVFPSRYPFSLEFAQVHKTHLVRWLYRHQSRERRYHLANRLFIILYAADGEHWKLRAELNGLQQAISAYVAGFDPAQLSKLTFKRQQVMADIIWLVK